MTETIARALYSQPQPQTHLVGEPVTNPVPALTYGPDFWNDFNPFENRKSWVTSRGLADNASVLVVGCGYGALIDWLIDAGIDDIYGLEPGSWIWDNINTFQPVSNVRDRIGNDWIGSGTERATLNTLGVSGQAKFSWIVDEDAALAHTDAELPVFISGLEDRLQGNARGRIIHIVTTLRVEMGPGDSSQNWKLLSEWKEVAPAHTWMDSRTGEIG